MCGFRQSTHLRGAGVTLTPANATGEGRGLTDAGPGLCEDAERKCLSNRTLHLFLAVKTTLLSG